MRFESVVINGVFVCHSHSETSVSNCARLVAAVEIVFENVVLCHPFELEIKNYAPLKH